MTASAVLSALKNAMDPMSAHIQKSYAAATANGRSLLYDNVSPL